MVMLICLLIGYPIAYFLAMRVTAFKWQLALFLLCMVPFWTSYLIRAVAWLPMLGRRGLINQALVNLGILDKPATFLFYPNSGMWWLWRRFTSSWRSDRYFSRCPKFRKTSSKPRGIWGQPRSRFFVKIIAPMSLPGVAIGMIFLFVMLMANSRRPLWSMVARHRQAGTVILNYYGIANYPFAAVNALMLMVAMVVGIIIILRLVDIRKEL